jgi:molybdate transport system regulatory protein
MSAGERRDMARPSRINANAAEYLPEGAQDPKADTVRLMVRVAFGRRGALGPGKMRLIELIDQHGSITAACKEMGMSYRRAWLLVEGLKQAFREPVLTTHQGGVAGGGCRLTPYGRSLLKRYRALERMAREAVREELQALEQELLPQAVEEDGVASGDDKALAS